MRRLVRVQCRSATGSASVFDSFEMAVGIAVVDGVVAFDTAGVAYCEPAHHQT